MARRASRCVSVPSPTVRPDPSPRHGPEGCCRQGRAAPRSTKGILRGQAPRRSGEGDLSFASSAEATMNALKPEPDLHFAPQIERLPRHLQRYVVDQQWDLYTPVDHAVWGYILRQAGRLLATR